MHTDATHRYLLRLRVLLGVLLSVTLIGVPDVVQAVCGLDGAALESIRSVADPQAIRALSQKIHQYGTCSICHLARFGGPRNQYGDAVNALLTLRDREDLMRQREVGRRLKDVLADPSLPDSPTFGELFQLGRFPAQSLANQEPPFPKVARRESVRVTAEQARELVKNVEAESRFGILQLSDTPEITREVAQELAEFRGETLMLGIKSLSPEVATALVKSRAENVWLHSVVSLSAEAADIMANLPGHLYLTALVELDSLPLATKLASRPGALSFPYLKELKPEIAAALAKKERSLTLAGLTQIPAEVQERIANTAGNLSLPNLRSIEVAALEEKLVAGVVLLPQLEKLTPKIAKRCTQVKGAGSFFGGVYLPLSAITPEVAAAFSESPNRINLILVGSGPISDQALTVLMGAGANLVLQDVETLTVAQTRIIATAFSSPVATPGARTGLRSLLPNLRRLDSPILAEILGPAGFPGVTTISTEAAAALGSLPDTELKRSDGTVEVRPSGELNFPLLEELSPDIARLLLKKRWLSISFPSLQEVSLETIRLMARQTYRLNLGISVLPPEFADAFAEMPTNSTAGGGFILFPNVTDLSPEAARILVKSLNRGVEGQGYTKVSKSPKLYLGGDLGFSGSGFPRLSPELAAELAKYEGVLAIQGLGQLPAQSAAALAAYPGPYLILSGPAAEKLSPEVAESLARVSGVLQIQLRHLDSVPLAQRFAQQINWTLYNLETVSREAAPALSQYKQFFDLRALKVLDSPEMARRFVEGTTTASSVTLPALLTLSSDAATILGTGSKPLYLGLTVLDSPAVARALAKSQRGVKLTRLRAATPEVMAILQDAKAIETPPLESIYVLPKSLLD
jgi:hypothetical protein